MSDREIEKIASAIADRLSGRFVSVVLTGAAARGEVTVDRSGRCLSDLDIVVILPQRSIVTAVPEQRRCQHLLHVLAPMFKESLFDHVSVELAPSSPSYWRMATPLMWELRASGRVLAGRSDGTSAPAICRSDEIPQWEAVRLVSNRLCELIHAVGRNAAAPGCIDELDGSAVRYACIKLALACSEAALIDSGRYASTYAERERRHLEMTGRFDREGDRLIRRAYAAKLRDMQVGPDDGRLVPPIRLALTTLAQLGVDSADRLTDRTRTEPGTAPGLLADLLSIVTTGRRPGRVLSRPIAQVYGDAYRLAEGYVDTAQNRGTSTAASWLELGQRYSRVPQVVAVLEPSRRDERENRTA